MKCSGSVKYVIAIIVSLTAGFFWTYRADKQRNAPTDANVGVVKRQDLVQRVTLSGQIWPRKRLDVKPPFTGFIQKLYVKIGDKVKRGSPLVTFSPSLGRGENNFPVRAVFDGTITQVQKSEGEYVTETGEQNLILRVEDLTQLFVHSSVPELDIAKLKVGQEAVIRVSSLIGESFSGKITEIAMSAKDKERWGSNTTEFQLNISVDSHDSRLAPGMSTLLDVNTNRANQVLTLGHEFIEEKDGNYFVTLVSGERKQVTLGLQTEDAAEVKSGLQEGDKVKIIDFLSLPKVE